MATHSSILAWRLPWTEEPGGPQSMGSQLDTTERLTLLLLKIKKNFFFLAAMGLRCCGQAFSACGEQGLLWSGGVEASLIANRLQARGLRNCGSQA